MDGKGWHNEPGRHGLASRGIRTRAIPTPGFKPSEHLEHFYTGMKGGRRFIGSGLEDIDPEDLILLSTETMDFLDKTNFDDENEYESFLNEVVDEFQNTIFECGLKRDVDTRRTIDDIFTIGLEPQSIYVFGSRVSGYYTPESDIDVAIVMKKNPEAMAIVRRGWTLDSFLFFKSLFDAVLVVLTREYGWGEIPVIGDEQGRDIQVDMGLMIEHPSSRQPTVKIWEAP